MIVKSDASTGPVLTTYIWREMFQVIVRSDDRFFTVYSGALNLDGSFYEYRPVGTITRPRHNDLPRRWHAATTDGKQVRESGFVGPATAFTALCHKLTEGEKASATIELLGM